MIDPAAVRAALVAPLTAGPIAAAHIGVVGRPFTPPAGDVPHARLSLLWEGNGKAGPTLWVAAGMLQVLVYVPFGAGADAATAVAMQVAALYQPHLDGPPLDYGVRVVQVAVLDATDLDDRSRAGASVAAPASWTTVPVQVDFRVERVDTGAL